MEMVWRGRPALSIAADEVVYIIIFILAITLTSRGMIETSMEYCNNLVQRVKKALNTPHFLDAVSLIAGIVLACVAFNLRLCEERYDESFRRLAMHNRSLLEFGFYLGFIGYLSWISTGFILSCGSDLMNIVKQEILPSPPQVLAFLGLTTGYFANLIWFKVVRQSLQLTKDSYWSTSKSLKYDSADLKTGMEFVFSPALPLLTAILVISTTVMWKHCKHLPYSTSVSFASISD